MNAEARRLKVKVDLINYSVRLVPRGHDWLIVLLSFLLGKRFITDFWTTYRLPGCRPVIAYPTDIVTPMDSWQVIEHELIHIKQFAPWYGPFVVFLLATVFPLPMFFSGRWFIERWAYALDIANGRFTVAQACDILWNQYGRAWPRELMRAWLQKHAGGR